MAADLKKIWQQGYSIAELWGASQPITRGASQVLSAHLMLWGILGIVEYQVDKGAGHNYLRDRLSRGEWITIGYAEPKSANTPLTKVPPIENAKFGKKGSAIGDGVSKYVDVRIVTAELFSTLYDSCCGTIGGDLPASS